MKEVRIMLKWAFVFLLIAIIAGLFGFNSIAGVSMGLSKLLFFIIMFLIILVIVFGSMFFK